MNRIITSVVAFLLMGNFLAGQIQNDILKVLATKDFVALKKYADSLDSRAKNVQAYWAYLRDVTNDYQEGIFYFDGSQKTFRVTLIATEKYIAYYELCSKEYKLIGSSNSPYFKTIGKFKDDSAFTVFKKSFHAIFAIDPDENELFKENFVYGTNCGYAGTAPAGRLQIDTFVKNKDKESLVKWLQSVNTEKQVYAVDGLHQLKKQGIALTKQELDMIEFVKNKRGTMNTCSGCIYFTEAIGEMTKEFKF